MQIGISERGWLTENVATLAQEYPYREDAAGAISESIRILSEIQL